MIERVVVGEMATNCYLVYDEQTRETFIIDPGDDPQLIANRISDLELTPVKILVTHGHFDHILGVNELKLFYNIPFFLSHKDKFLLRRMRNSAKKYLGEDPGPAPYVDFDIKESGLTILDTPGHTPGSVCIYYPEVETLFSGDTILADGEVGRTDFAYSDKGLFQKSIESLFSLPKNTLVYPGHGESFYLAQK